MGSVVESSLISLITDGVIGDDTADQSQESKLTPVDVGFFSFDVLRKMFSLLLHPNITFILSWSELVTSPCTSRPVTVTCEKRCFHSTFWIAMFRFCPILGSLEIQLVMPVSASEQNWTFFLRQQLVGWHVEARSRCRPGSCDLAFTRIERFS